MTVDFIEVWDTMYAVKLHEGPILKDGKQWKTYVDHDGETIRISDSIPEGDRMTATAHAVSLAWKTYPVPPAFLLDRLPFVSAAD